MKRCCLLVSMIIVAACGQPAPDAVPIESDAAAQQDEMMTGAQAYEHFCAACHEEGLDGAPRTGDRETWTGRSWLWEAVLFEHAKSGYLTMPARGGDGRIEDQEIARAAEYMLSLTFPEAHPD